MVDLQQLENNKFVEGTGYPKTTVRTTDFSKLIPVSYDFVDVDYTDGNITTVIYKTGGASGTTVATLTITYTVDDCIDTITKT